MSTSKENRYNNLIDLIELYNDGNGDGGQIRLSEITETPVTYINNIKNKVLAKNGNVRNMGDSVAQRFEEKLNKPRGWMDQNHSTNQTKEPDIADDKGGELTHEKRLAILLNDRPQYATYSDKKKHLYDIIDELPDNEMDTLIPLGESLLQKYKK